MQTRAADIYDLNSPRPEIGVCTDIVVTAISSVPGSGHNTFKKQTLGTFKAQAMFKPATFPILPPHNSHRLSFHNIEHTMNAMTGPNGRKGLRLCGNVSACRHPRALRAKI